MSGFNDNYGAKIGMLVTCKKCGEQIFLQQTGYNNLDAAMENRHSFYDQFEKMPDNWKVVHDVGGWLCPKCLEEYNILIDKFRLSK